MQNLENSFNEEKTNSDILQNLPQIVYLRGDEEYAPDFSIDASQAMTSLGIKRSRLTQISGHELRVGRIRVDRYIKPVYRPEDIDNYIKWTRATASHQSASKALENTGDQIISQVQNLLEKQDQDPQIEISNLHMLVKGLYDLQRIYQNSFNNSNLALRQMIGTVEASQKTNLLEVKNSATHILNNLETKNANLIILIKTLTHQQSALNQEMTEVKMMCQSICDHQIKFDQRLKELAEQALKIIDASTQKEPEKQLSNQVNRTPKFNVRSRRNLSKFL